MSESIEPPSIRDLADAAEIAWRNVMIAESQGLQPGGCCSADTWRGHLCEYHQGYADGVDDILDRLRAVDAMLRTMRSQSD